MFKNPLSHVQNEIAAMPELKRHKSDMWQSIATFGGRFAKAIRMMKEEPEILAFAAMQWLVILLGVWLWFQILHFAPSEPTAMAPEQVWIEGLSLVVASLIVGSIWTIAVIILVALPVGVLSAAMVAAHILRRRGQQSTFRRCLEIAWRQYRVLWMYHAIDGYVTVQATLARLPKRNGNRSKIDMVIEELLYFAWKLGCIGMLPAMVSGHGLLESGRRSVRFVKSKFAQLAVLRGGYGLMCWGIGSAAYALPFTLMIPFRELTVSLIGTTNSTVFTMIHFGLPIFGALALILIVLQPVYLLTVSDIYADHLEELGEPITLSVPAANGEAPELVEPIDLGWAGYVAIAVLAAVLAYHFGLASLGGLFDRGAA
ncbi:MAG: hypothetical protein AAF709_14245 [Pseudomonadota bacterium]